MNGASGNGSSRACARFCTAYIMVSMEDRAVIVMVVEKNATVLQILSEFFSGIYMTQKR